MKIDKIFTEHEERLNKKFKYFDERMAQNKPAWLYTKSDPTLFAYYFFTDPKDRKKPFKVFPFQDIVLNDNSKRIVLVIARQTGKSTIAAIRAIHKAYWNDDYLILIISSTKDQAKELIHRMDVLLKTARFIVWKVEESKSEIKIENPNKMTRSRIISVPATDAARGYSPNEVILDEADFMENGEYFFKNVVLPSVQNTNGTLCIYTTPNPFKHGGFVYEASNQDDLWNIYQFDWRVNPNTTEDKIADVRKMMTMSEFACEYEAKFPVGENAFFKESLVRIAQDEDCGDGGTLPENVILVGGVDFAKISDKSLIYIGYIENPQDEPNAQIVKVWRRIEKPLGTDYTAVLAEIRDLHKRFGVSKFYIDATGVGEVPADILKNDGIPIEPIKFSMQSKAEIFHNLKFLFEQKRIKIPATRSLHEQLVTMEHEYLAYNKLKIHHPEGGHDDECDALALMAYGLSRSYQPAGIAFVERKNKDPFEKRKEGELKRMSHVCDKCGEYFKAEAEKHFSLHVCPKCE